MTALFWVLLTLATGAAALDIISTKRGLSIGLTELNPAARRLFDRLGVVGAGIAMKVPQFALAIYIAHRAPGTWGAVAAAAIVLAIGAYAAVSNLRAIERKRRGL